MTTAESLLIAAIIAAIGLYAAPDLVAWWAGGQPVMVR
jgi:Tfp pilus assembly protein FimT